MKKLQQNPPVTFRFPTRVFNFAITFLLGLGMALGFALLVSYTTFNNGSIKLFGWLQLTLNPTYLSLTIAGALGGLLYSILLDGTLEVPAWDNKNNGLKPGFLGEIFVGIGGAFIAYVALPDILKIPARVAVETIASNDVPVPDQTGIIIFVTGLVGGYGGKAILDTALKKVIDRVKMSDLAKEKAEAQAKVLQDRKNLLELVNAQIEEGLNSSELLELQEGIKNAPDDVRERAFTLASDARRLGRRAIQFKDRVKRTVPIFEALLVTDNDKPEYHAQLAYAYIELNPPQLEDAVRNLDQAIQLRGESIQGNTWDYELHRAIARILILNQQGAQASSSPLSVSILQDLAVVDRTKGLGKAIGDYKTDGIDLPIENWLTQNQDWVAQQFNGKALLNQIKLTSSAKTATPAVTPPVALAAIPPSYPQAAKNGSAKEAINQLERHSALPTANTGTLKAAATRARQSSATATKSTIATKTARGSSSHQESDIITRQQAESVYGRAITDKQFKDLNDCLHRFEINTLARIRHFLSQTAHESGGLRWMEELANGSAYERRRDLGNTSPGDGRKFKGAGVIQLTGRHNYQKFADFIGNPKVMLGHTYVAQEYPFTSAGFWWENNKMNARCDRGETCRQISAKVNGRDPANGLPDREHYYKKACQVILQSPSHSSVSSLHPARLPAAPVQFASVASPKSIITSVDPLDFQLSTHFKLREFVYSQTAIQKHINNTPQQIHIAHLKQLCEQILEPARVALGPLQINSGYRCPALNKAVGGANNSAHLYGYAADVVPKQASKLEFARWVQKNCQFDQIILEFGTRQDPSWIHVSCDPKNRKQVLRAPGYAIVQTI